MTDNGATTTYCYDAADRLTSSSDAAVGSPAYDARGNTTTLGAQALAYDGADRHASTATGFLGLTNIRYRRDATGRIVERTEGLLTVTRYGHSGPGDSPSFAMNALNLVTEATVPLVGGATVTKRLGGVADVWSYPNVHGDTTATAGFLLGGLVPTGVTKASYDPNGNALGAIPDNADASFDYGWLGQAQRPTEHTGG